MLLKRKEKDGVIKALYESSNILASTYEPNTNKLTIVFGSGVGYEYDNVSKKDYTLFELADSQGATFNKNLRSHSYRSIGEVDVDAIRAELQESKEEEIRIINEDILATANKVTKDGNLINEEALHNLVKLYNARKIKLSNE